RRGERVHLRGPVEGEEESRAAPFDAELLRGGDHGGFVGGHFDATPCAWNTSSLCSPRPGGFRTIGNPLPVKRRGEAKVRAFFPEGSVISWIHCMCATCESASTFE